MNKYKIYMKDKKELEIEADTWSIDKDGELDFYVDNKRVGVFVMSNIVGFRLIEEV